MATNAAWHSVRGLSDGQNVDAETLNRPIAELASRTDYLKNRLDALGGLDCITVRDVRLSETDTPDVGDIVFVDPETKLYSKAIASMSLYDAYTASERAYAVGMLTYRSGYSGYVTLYGKVDISGMDVDGMVEKGPFENGQYYLSSTTPGKITRFPTGPRILVGFFARNDLVSGSMSGGFAIVNPQHMDIEAHAHRTYRLKPRPAGELRYVSDDSNDAGSVAVVGYSPEGGSLEGVPRLTICGDLTTNLSPAYEVSFSDGAGNTPTSWPCVVSWTAEDGDTGSGTATMRFFGDEVPVGSLGMAVRLAPSDGQGLDRPFQSDVDASYRTWRIDREKARGWTDSSANVVSAFGTMYAVLSGSSDTEENHIEIDVPERVYDLTELFDGVSAGDSASINGQEFVFDDGTRTEQEGTTLVQIGTSDYATLCALAEKCASLVACDDAIEQVLVGGTVSRNGEECDPSLDNEGQAKYAIAADSRTKRSLAVPSTFGGAKSFSLVPLENWSSVPLANGMSVSFMGDGQFLAGDGLVQDVRFPCGGTAYRYAIEFDNDLKKHFPPVPAKSGSLMLNGVELEGYDLYGDPAVFAIGDDSVYWRDPSFGRTPWPSSYDGGDVPPEDEYRLVFHFVSEFHSETGPVTSLRSGSGSPIKVRRCGTDEDANVGDLELDLDLMLETSDQGVAGYKVGKATRNGRILLGPVVEKLIAGPGISFSQKSGMPDGQGTVTISADGTEYCGDFETVALENAKLESIGMFPYTRFLPWNAGGANIPTGFVAKFHVPATAHDALYRVKFYATVFGETSFSDAMAPRMAGVTMDFNILPDYSSTGLSPETANLKTGLIKPDSPAVLDIPFGSMRDDGSYGYDAFDPLLIHNDSSIEDEYGRSAQVYDHAFPTKDDCSSYVKAHGITSAFGVKPGYTVAIRFSRSAPTAAGEPYTGAIGFLNLRWSVEEVASLEAERADYVDNLVTRTVLDMRRAASKAGPMEMSYDVVDVLKKILNALK